MFSCLIHFPPQQPSAFLRPGVKTATGRAGEGDSGCGWAWGGEGDPPPQDLTHTPGPPPSGSQGLGADPLGPFKGEEENPPTSPGKTQGRPRGLWEGKLANKGAGHRPVTLGLAPALPHFLQPPKSGSTHSRGLAPPLLPPPPQGLL